MPSITHVISSVGPKAFGLAPVALNLAKEQLAAGWNADIWSLDPSLELKSLAVSNGLPQDSLYGFRRKGPAFLCYSPQMNHAVRTGRSAMVFHQHGIWTFLSRTTNTWRVSHRGPTVICPHGSLEPWTLRRSRWKKWLALLAYESENLRGATCLHAVGSQEIAGFRSFGLRNPIAVIPNGLSASYLHRTGSGRQFRAMFDVRDDQRVALFLSRITPKKGLPMLLQALSGIKPIVKDWVVAIAGVDEFDHEREVRALTRQMELENIVRFVGPLYGSAKRDAYAAAELFVLPSHSEGFPMVVLEALASGVPVLTTQSSPWQELSEHRCGWWTNISAEDIAKALSEALRSTSADLAAMGERGRQLVRTNYTWARMAAKTVKLYEWLLGQGPIPEFVVMN